MKPSYLDPKREKNSTFIGYSLLRPILFLIKNFSII